jgi:hypothetical protein
MQLTPSILTVIDEPKLLPVKVRTSPPALDAKAG